MFTTPPESKKKAFKVKVKSPAPDSSITDRHQILKDLRENTKKFGSFTDEQLLYITDPEVLEKLSDKTQPQKIQEFLKNQVFQEFKGNLTQPVLCLIFQTFKVTDSKKDKKKGSVEKPTVKAVSKMSATDRV